jgi:hypothetical protein
MGPLKLVSYDFDPEQVTATLLEAGLSREEVWSLLTITKTNLQKGLRRLNRKELVELAISTGTIRASEKVAFSKNRQSV